MLKLKGLRTTIYKVDDVEAATRWYRHALGFEPYFMEPFYVGFNVGGYELGLQPQEEDKPKTPSVITYWGVDNVEETFKKLLELGASSFEQPEEVGGGIIVAAVKDPWQNIFGIIYNPTFKLE